AAAVAALAIVAAIVLLFLLPSKAGRVTVPDVTGETQSAAVNALKQRGLAPAASLTANARVASGLVIGTTPPHGTIVKKGSRVSVFVSSGPGVLGLPNVNAKKSDEALKILREKGFQPTVQSQSSDTVAKGLVISTDPAAGIEVQVGSPVTVFVSSGPQEVSVPDVTNESQANATATLAAAGLKVTASKREVAEPAAGTVISQSPSAGSRLKVGGEVTIVVAQALKQVAVPSVIGQSEAQAAAALVGAGFASHTVARTVTDPSKVGVVVQQSPEAGRKLAKGAVVTIAVGKLGQQTTSTSTSTTPTPPATTPGAAPAAGTLGH
ncbi:MAG TPA: PASTA domain-containing protein, partial [Solirubrobacteraceae bacterium]|nr:PASTA domain-containing protein [Solirubrobacteraceae bacterium]